MRRFRNPVGHRTSFAHFLVCFFLCRGFKDQNDDPGLYVLRDAFYWRGGGGRRKKKEVLELTFTPTNGRAKIQRGL